MRTSRLLSFAVLLAGFAAARAAPSASAVQPLEGLASWYGVPFHGRKTASGEVFDRFAFTAAHRSLPFGTVLLVTNLDSGLRAVVRVNDRGPFVEGRMIDLSEAAARELGLIGSGIGRVRIEDSGGMAPGPLGGPAVRAGEAGSASRAAPERTPVPAPSPRARFCDVQVASFSRPDNARRAVERLEAAGFKPEEERAGPYTRVLIRSLPAEEGENVRRRLAGMGFPGALLSFYERE